MDFNIYRNDQIAWTGLSKRIVQQRDLFNLLTQNEILVVVAIVGVYVKKSKDLKINIL